MGVKVEETGSTTIEIRIPIEWYGLGKDYCMRYAERIAESVYLSRDYCARNAVPDNKGECVVVRLAVMRR